MRRTFGLLFCALAATATATAGEVPENLPASTILYVHVSDLPSLPDRIESLPAFAPGDWRAETVQRVQDLLFGALAEEMEIERERALEFLRTCRALHLALLSFDIQDEDKIEGVAVLELGDAAPALALIGKELAEFFRKSAKHGPHTVWDLSEEGGPRVQAALAGSTFVLAIGEGVLGRYLDAESGDAPDRLAEVAEFRKAREEFSRMAAWGYVSPPAILSRIKTSLDYDDREEFDRVDGMFAFADFRAVGFGSSFETAPGDVSTRVRIYHEQDNPFLEVFASQPAGGEPFRFMPEGTVFAIATDVGKGGETWKAAREFIARFEREVVRDDDFERGLAEMKDEAGFDLDEAFGLVDGPAAVFLPEVGGGIDEDHVSFLFHLADPAAAKAWVEKVRKEGEAFRELAEEGKFKSKTYRDVTIEYVDDRYERWGYAFVGEWFLASGHIAALEAAIDAHAGAAPSLVTRYGDVMEKFPAAHAKTLYFDPAFLLGLERETTFAIPRLRRDWPLLVGSIEGEDALDLEANASIFGFFAALGLGVWQEESTHEERSACSERLDRLGQAVWAYRAKHENEWPESLAVAAREAGIDAAATCPAHGGEYVYSRWPKVGDDDLPWSAVLAHCPHLEHGRIALLFYGPDEAPQAYPQAEWSFRRTLQRTKDWLEEVERR